MQGSGATIQMKKKASEFKSGPTVAFMKVSGKTAKQMEKVDSSTQMEISITATGKTIWLMDSVLISIRMAPSTTATGTKTDNMVKVTKFGLMVQPTRAAMFKERSMDKESSGGQIKVNTTAK